MAPRGVIKGCSAKPAGGDWKKALLEKASELFEGKRGPQAVSEQSDPERLYSEIGRLKVELDWLKKKSGLSLSR